MGTVRRLSLAALFAACWLFLPPRRAAAVVIGNPDPSGNITAPAGIPGWYNVGLVDVGTPPGIINASGVYVGNGWVLTANHVGTPSGFTIGGTTYSPAAGSDTRLTNPDQSPTDLQLFRLTSSPALPDLNLAPNSPAAGTQIFLMAYGAQATGPAVTNGPYEGFAETFTIPQSELWGSNLTVTVDPTTDLPMPGGVAISPLDIGNGAFEGFYTQFYTDNANYPAGNGTSEAQIGSYDSGGAVFDSAGELIGIADANNSAVPGYASFGDASAYVDLPYYRQEIIDITDIPEPASIVLIPMITAMALGRRTRSR